MKSVTVAVCGMKCIDLCKDTIRITVVHFSYNKTKQDEKNILETISKIQSVLKIWRVWSLTLEGKIILFKTLAISKIVYLSMMSKVPTEIIVGLKKYKNSSFDQLNQKLKTKQYLPISKMEFLKCRYKQKESKPSVLLDKKIL